MAATQMTGALVKTALFLQKRMCN